jgi:hypothetical protein
MDMANDLNHNGATGVALVSCTGVLGDVIRRTVATLPDVAVVQDLPYDDLPQLSVALRQAHPDVVVWLMNDESILTDHTELFSLDRGCAVIAVLDDGRRSSLWELRPHRTVLDPPSIDRLIDVLRSATVRS